MVPSIDGNTRQVEHHAGTLAPWHLRQRSAPSALLRSVSGSRSGWICSGLSVWRGSKAAPAEVGHRSADGRSALGTARASAMRQSLPRRQSARRRAVPIGRDAPAAGRRAGPPKRGRRRWSTSSLTSGAAIAARRRSRSSRARSTGSTRSSGTPPPRSRRERERACDDEVLRLGAQPVGVRDAAARSCAQAAAAVAARDGTEHGAPLGDRRPAADRFSPTPSGRRGDRHDGSSPRALPRSPPRFWARSPRPLRRPRLNRRRRRLRIDLLAQPSRKASRRSRASSMSIHQAFRRSRRRSSKR